MSVLGAAVAVVGGADLPLLCADPAPHPSPGGRFRPDPFYDNFVGAVHGTQDRLE